MPSRENVPSAGMIVEMPLPSAGAWHGCVGWATTYDAASFASAFYGSWPVYLGTAVTDGWCLSEAQVKKWPGRAADACEQIYSGLVPGEGEAVVASTRWRLRADPGSTSGWAWDVVNVKMFDAGDARLKEMSDQFWADNAYDDGEPDRVVLCVGLKAEKDGKAWKTLSARKIFNTILSIFNICH